MNKLKALIVTLVVGSSSVAMASPATFSARGSISFGVRRPVVVRPAPRPVNTVIVRDHRFNNQLPRYTQVNEYEHANCGTTMYSVSGMYNSAYGRVQLFQNGDRVTGSFEAGGGGTIEGRIINGQIYFTWQNSAEHGRGIWRVSANGRIDGTWGQNDSDFNGGAWTLTIRS